ncbi:MAG: AAA family ATPase [Rhodobacteraceae bacterium]|nr:AAA family ATPase [Paracoccaceae bacterium]
MPEHEFYTDVFNLRERPFTLLPDPEFIFWTREHTRAYAVLQYGIMSRSPLTIITGEVGAGKTTLVQKLLSEPKDDLTVGLISNAQGGRGELLQWVLNALRHPAPQGASYVEMFQRLQDFLISEYSEGRRVALIIDEAQNLSVEGLEELRMLTNVNSNKDELVQFILVGQPELRQMIMRPELRQFAQRVSANYHLPSMASDTVSDYITHRLVTAGGTGNEFTKQACEKIFKATGGVPRLVNQLCDFCMIYTSINNSRLVLASTVEQVLADGVFFAGFIAEDAPDNAPTAAKPPKSSINGGGAA